MEPRGRREIGAARAARQCTGPVDTVLLDGAFAARGDAAEARKAEIASVHLGRSRAPADIASVSAFLVSNAASFVTGVAWSADGGKSAV